MQVNQPYGVETGEYKAEQILSSDIKAGDYISIVREFTDGTIDEWVGYAKHDKTSEGHVTLDTGEGVYMIDILPIVKIVTVFIWRIEQ